MTISLLLACLTLPATAVGVDAGSPPGIEYFAPSPLRNHEATLRFAVDPEGLATEYEVEYGLGDGEYFEFHYLWDKELPAGDEPVPGEAKLPAYWEGRLTPGTEYHWRVVATNAAGTTEGPDETFTTPDEPAPVLVNGAAGPLGSSGASFEGTVDPEGVALTGCSFRWVTDTVFQMRGFTWHDAIGVISLGETVPCAENPGEIGSGSAPVAVHADVADLDPGLYRVRLEAENEFEGGAAVGGLPFEVGGVAKPGETCPQPPGCSPPLPVSSPAPPSAAPQSRAKPHRTKHRKRLRRNATIRARR